jgi:hypothetical protein
MHRKELLRDVSHVEPHFGPFGCNIGAWFAPNIPSAQKSFWTNPMVLLGDELNWKFILDHLETVLI